MSVVETPVPGDYLTVGEYHRLIDAGRLSPDDPVELLDGELVDKMPNTPRHASRIGKIGLLLRSSLDASTWLVREQSPVTLSSSEPEPDVAIVAALDYEALDRHPHAADIEVVIEVAVSSLATDRVLKARLYAEAAIPLYVVVAADRGWIEIRREPHNGSYRLVERLAEGTVVLAGSTVAVSELLPPI